MINYMFDGMVVYCVVVMQVLELGIDYGLVYFLQDLIDRMLVYNVWYVYEDFIDDDQCYEINLVIQVFGIVFLI